MDNNNTAYSLLDFVFQALNRRGCAIVENIVSFCLLVYHTFVKMWFRLVTAKYCRDVGAFSKVRPRLLQLRFGVSAPKNHQKIIKNHQKSSKSVHTKTSKSQGRFELDEAAREFS